MSSFSIRPAVKGDEGALFDLICALAFFERLEDAVTGSAANTKGDTTASPPVMARSSFAGKPLVSAQSHTQSW